MSTHISWFAGDYSINPFLGQEDSSQFLIKNNENSISYFGRYSSYPREQESKSMFNIQAILQNSIGKSQGFLNKEQIVYIQILNDPHNQPILSNSIPESQSQIQQPQEEMVELGNKKGLKNLAKLLIRTLKRKKFDSSKYLTEEIEEKLLKSKKITKNEYARQSKNIRRRTYDALNVMMAANILGPDLALIRRVNSGSFTKKCALIIGQKNEVETKISSLSEKVNSKKEFLESLRQKKSALDWWMRMKKIEAANNPTQLQSQNQQVQKKEKNQKAKIKNTRISLPIVVIAEKEFEEQKKISMNNLGVVKISDKNKRINIFSDIDCFSILKWNSELQEKMREMTKIEDNVDNPDAKSLIKEERLQKSEDFIQFE